MGIMSKNSRFPERPEPPALNEIEEDLHKAKDTDIALSIGGKYLQNMNLAASSPSFQEPDWPSSPDTSSSSVEQTDVSQDQLKGSYNKVLHFLKLESELKKAPKDLEDNFSQLQITGAEISESIAQLKSLSQSIEKVKGVIDCGSPQERQGKSSTRQSDSKHKNKSKRKK